MTEDRFGMAVRLATLEVERPGLERRLRRSRWINIALALALGVAVATGRW